MVSADHSAAFCTPPQAFQLARHLKTTEQKDSTYKFAKEKSRHLRYVQHLKHYWTACTSQRLHSWFKLNALSWYFTRLGLVYKLINCPLLILFEWFKTSGIHLEPCAMTLRSMVPVVCLLVCLSWEAPQLRHLIKWRSCGLNCPWTKQTHSNTFLVIKIPLRHPKSSYFDVVKY